MAVIPVQIEQFGSTAVRATWKDLRSGDVGAATHNILFQDRSVQVLGTFGVGGTATVEGSNDGTTFVTLTDMRGNDLAILAPKIEQVEDCSFAVRPVVVGDGTTNLTVIMFARKGD